MKESSYSGLKDHLMILYKCECYETVNYEVNPVWQMSSYFYWSLFLTICKKVG